MDKRKILLIVKYTAYGLLLLFLYVLQTTPRLFVVFGAKPMLVVPAAIAIAMVEGEFVGGIAGAFAGLLCDVSSDMLFGFNGLFIALFCIGAGLAVIYLMHCNTGGAVLFVFVTMLVRGGVEYLFGYHMWGYENVWKVFAYHIFPVILYTTATAPLLFWPVRCIFQFFQRRLAVE